ncbi:MAG: hypothetical protein WEF53_00035 [Bacteroidota bacterium]
MKSIFTSKSIRTVALLGALTLTMPVSAIVRVADSDHDGHPSGAAHSCPVDPAIRGLRPLDEPPARHCPVLELRAGLALISLKSESRPRVDPQPCLASLNDLRVFPKFPPDKIQRDFPVRAPVLSVLGVLRI